jgi:Ni,Fe-hydrogenase III small subunit/NAD-dependent dihydropyrimidine dehydrogenase PreA subunit
MLNALKVRLSQGRQYILDPRQMSPRGFRGRPVISDAPCKDGCRACESVCPTRAIALDPVRIDLGRCVFCNECALACEPGKIIFTNEYRMAATSPEGLVVKSADTVPSPVAVSESIRRLFGRSLKMRSVSAGGCNGCELELNALGNVNFDAGRYGIEFVASPRHADALVLSGPITENMKAALENTYAAMPEPKFVIAFGACAISGGLYDGAPGIERTFLGRFQPSLYVPGCPPHPLTFIVGLLDLLGIDTRGTAPDVGGRV